MANTNVVPQGLFGPGILWLTRTDIANPTPVNVGFVNEFSTDFSFDVKELFGQNQFPLLAARGTAKATGKIKAATLSGQALNALLFGGNFTTGTQYDATTTIATPIPTTPYQITPTVPSSGAFNQDLGVVNAATSQPLKFVASAPGAGQYTANPATGVYTFSSADQGSGISVIISFAYTYTSGATGQNIVISNPLIGTNPTFQLDYKTTLYGATYYVRLYQSIGGKWSQQHKLTDFSMPEYDFHFFANAQQQIGLISLASQA